MTIYNGNITSPERQSARMSKITNDDLTRSGIGFFIAVLIWQQWVSKVKVTGRQSYLAGWRHYVKSCSRRRRRWLDRCCHVLQTTWPPPYRTHSWLCARSSVSPVLLQTNMN